MIYQRPTNDKVLRPVHPNQGVEAEYRRRLRKLIEEMHASVTYWIKQVYENHPPAVMAQDALSSAELNDAIKKLTRQWLWNFDKAAEAIATYFAKDVADRSDAALVAALRKSGFVLSGLQMTRGMEDILGATVHANVSLIKSIPVKYLNDVEGAVMRSVQAGRDLGTLSKELQKHYGVTKERAALIARDQNNKATSAMQRARQQELGIKYAIWMHSHAGKEPRPSHVRMDGKRYDVNKGMWDSDESKWVFPGELINCRCTSRSIVPGAV